jgi:uncharacterized protein YfaS (alpha-2-macroglobulin family)
MRLKLAPSIASVVPRRLLRPWALLLTSFVACVPTNRAPSVTPSGTLQIGEKDAAARKEGPFRVVYAGPQGPVGVGTQLSIVFSRPLRSLELAGSEAAPPLQISPSLPGRWEWVGTSALNFVPEGGRLPSATRIAVTVPAGTRALDGSPLDKEFRFEVTTPRPALVSSTPSNGQTGLERNQTFELRFNQTIEKAELEKKVTLSLVQAKQRRAVPFSLSMPDEKNQKLFVLTPRALLPTESTIELSLAKSLRGTEGPLETDEERTLHFETYGKLRVSEVRCNTDTPHGRCAPKNSISIELSNPVKFGDLKKALTIDPPLPIRWDSWQGDSDTSTYIDVSAPFAAGQSYTFKVAGTLKDVHGQALGTDYSKRMDVDDFWPQVEVGVSGDYFELATRSAIPVASLNVPSYALYTAPLTLAQVTEYYATSQDYDEAFRTLTKQKGVTERRVRPAKTPNRPHEEKVDPAQVLAKTGGRGPMLLAVQFAGRSQEERRATIVQVTDIALSAKLSRTGSSLVWVTSLSTGAPIPGAEVSVTGGPKVQPVVTDQNGFATLPAGSLGPDPNRTGHSTLVSAKKGNDWAFRRVSDYVSPWRANVSTDPFGVPQSYGLVFTERGIYRPGDEVQVKGILRKQAEGGNALLANRSYELVLRSPDWEETARYPIKTNAFGTFAQSIKVPATASLGSFRVEVDGLEDEGSASTSFEVAEYRPVEIEAKVSSDKPSYVHGARATFEVNGDYLFGAPMGGAGVTYRVTRSETSWALPNTDAFSSDASLYDSAHPEKAPAAGMIASDEGKLDAQGRLVHPVELALPGQRGPELVSFDAEVTDVSRQTVASSSTAVVHAADLYVALAYPDPYFIEAPGKLNPKLLVATPEGVRQAGKNVRLELVRRRWTLVRETSGGSARSEMRTVDDVVSTCSAVSTQTTATCALDVKEAGYYVILATVKDARGRVARAAVDAYALGTGESFWPDDDALRVELVPDKKQYNVGDTARVLVKSPFKQAEALVTVEADGVLSQRRVKLTGATPTVTVPITDRFRPNAYVSVHLLRARSSAPPAAGKADVGAPTYRAGHAELRIDPEARRLKVALTPSKKELRPGETIDVALEVKDSQGKGTPSEVTVYAVDEGVLSLIGYRTPDPLPVFTAPRPLRTATLESRESLARVSRDLSEALGLGGSKGADGGGGGDEGGARRDFRQSAYFNPAVMTGKDGKAKVSFKLPESLTTFRLMAVATTPEDRYGYAETRVVTNKRLMARPALPRLLRAGDNASAGIVLSAKGFGPADVNVTLRASGLDVQGPTTQSVKLPRDGSAEVRFPLAASTVGTSKLRFDVSGTAGGVTEKDAVEVERRILSPATLETVALYGETEDAAAERLGSLDAARRDMGGLKVQAASTALVGIDQGMTQLIDYPYGCTEQLSSRLLPLLPLRALAKDFNVALPRDIDRVIDRGTADILSRQRGDGGFGMWPESTESSPWVSPYATWTLFEAKQRGVAVPDRAFEEAKQYLRRQLEGRREPWWRAVAAFQLDVLAMLGAPDPGYMSTLFQERAELPVFAKALLLHAMVVSKQPKTDIDTLTQELENGLRIEANRAYFTENLGDDYAVLMDSPARTTAIVMRSLIAARPDHPLGARLARGLLAERDKGTWRSTQETAFSLLALDAYRNAQEKTVPDFVTRLWFGKDQLAEFTFTGKSAAAQSKEIPFAKLGTGDLVFDKQGPGKLFYEARLSYARKTLPTDVLDRGFFVQKTLRPVTPEELEKALATVPSQGVLQLPAGSLVVADLVIVTPSPRDYVVIDDPLPAGLEAVDAQLKTSAAWTNVSGSTTDDEPPSYDDVGRGDAYLSSWYRRELRDDRVLFFADHLPAGIYHYRYLARATTFGRFVVPPTRAEEMYTPEVFGRTASSVVEVR